MCYNQQSKFSYHLPGTAAVTDPRAWFSCEGDLLHSCHGCSLRGRLLNNHVSRDWLWPLLETLEGRTLPSSTLLSGIVHPRRALHRYLAAWFLWLLPLDQLALVARDMLSWSFQSNVAVEKTVLGQVPFLRHCTDSRLGQPPSTTPAMFSVKEACLFAFLKLWPKEQASRLAYVWWPTELLSRNRCILGSFPLSCSSSSVSHRKELHTCQKTDSCNFPGYTSRSLGSGGQKGLLLQSLKSVYICILLRAAAWWSGFQSA